MDIEDFKPRGDLGSFFSGDELDENIDIDSESSDEILSPEQTQTQLHQPEQELETQPLTPKNKWVDDSDDELDITIQPPTKNKWVDSSDDELST